MEVLTLARWQFAITTVYHFFFVPLTLGLSILVAIMETFYVRTGNELYKQMTRFWGKLFIINFVMGVVTGIVQEFQFGMNWSEYARFMGDIFGAPLAIEALLAFYLESTFLGVWIFGWQKLSRGLHLATIWLVAIASNLSALWILIANSFMHQPVGYVIRNGRAEMADFLALVTNPHVLLQYPHVLFSGVATAAFFVLGISAYHLLKKSSPALFERSFRLAAVYGLIGSLMVMGFGHLQGQHMMKTQPAKMAAAEALWETEQPAAFSVVAWIDEQQQTNPFALRIPGVVSFLAYNNFSARVEGLKELQARYEQQYGPDDYIPPVVLNFWGFRLMVGAGTLMALLAAVALFFLFFRKQLPASWLLRLLPFAIALPYLANTFGWILTETGRQPWIVVGLQKIQDAVSPNVTAGSLLVSLIGFTLLYGALMVVDLYLLARAAKAGPAPESAGAH